jgi:hypothetical protein
MFRLSIAGVLWLIVLAALNLAVLHDFESLLDRGGQGPEPIVLLTGLMPLIDAFLICCYTAVTGRYRFMLMPRGTRRDFAGAFAAITGVMLASFMFLCFAAPKRLSEPLGILIDPYVRWLDAQPLPGSRGPLIGATLCLVMSGPLLVISAVFSFIMSRYRLVITRRMQGAPAADDPL